MLTHDDAYRRTQTKYFQNHACQFSEKRKRVSHSFFFHYRTRLPIKKKSAR
jgi:hypothetical protein